MMGLGNPCRYGHVTSARVVADAVTVPVNSHDAQSLVLTVSFFVDPGESRLTSPLQRLCLGRLTWHL